MSRRPVGIHRQLQPTPTTPRAHFERWLDKRFRGVRVVNGTRSRQTSEVFSRRVNGQATTIPANQQVLPNWQPWSETAAVAELYDNAIQAIEDVAGVFGGAPIISEVVLYATEYKLTAAGAVPTGNVGASSGAGQLTIYGSASTVTKGLPVARSTTSGRYPMVVLGVAGVPGQSPGAPIPAPSRDESQRRVVAHELGHGIAEAAEALDPHVFDAWNLAVGWQKGSLYDVQAPGVKAALAAPTAPPASALITVDDWNSPAHGEQPMSDYAVSGGPSEDFAESVMAFVYEPALLNSRSPARYAFFRRAAHDAASAARAAAPGRRLPSTEGRDACRLSGCVSPRGAPRPSRPAGRSTPPPARAWNDGSGTTSRGCGSTRTRKAPPRPRHTAPRPSRSARRSPLRPAASPPGRARATSSSPTSSPTSSSSAPGATPRAPTPRAPSARPTPPHAATGPASPGAR